MLSRYRLARHAGANGAFGYSVEQHSHLPYSVGRDRDLITRLQERFSELNDLLLKGGAWSPISYDLLKFNADLRGQIHSALAHFLPIVPANEQQDELDWGDNEWDRPQGKALQDFLLESMKSFQEDATVEDGLKTLALTSMKDKLPEANFELMAHRAYSSGLLLAPVPDLAEILGVAFMVKREKSHAGGLLCDAMGKLGLCRP